MKNITRRIKKGTRTAQTISWNCGVEGETDDPAILSLREKQRRNFMITLLLSQGVPMLAGGDEIGRTQRGNNNPYSQDNETGWYNWDLTDSQADFLCFTKQAISILRSNPVFCRRNFLQEEPTGKSAHKDIIWLLPSGQEREHFDNHSARVLGICLSGDAIDETDELGHNIIGETTLILLNAEDNPINFVLPNLAEESRWILVLDTSGPKIPPSAFRKKRIIDPDHRLWGGEAFLLAERSVSIFRLDFRSEKRD
jgi:glycogen operon protein